MQHLRSWLAPSSPKTEADRPETDPYQPKTDVILPHDMVDLGRHLCHLNTELWPHWARLQSEFRTLYDVPRDPAFTGLDYSLAYVHRNFRKLEAAIGEARATAERNSPSSHALAQLALQTTMDPMEPPVYTLEAFLSGPGENAEPTMPGGLVNNNETTEAAPGASSRWYWPWPVAQPTLGGAHTRVAVPAAPRVRQRSVPDISAMPGAWIDSDDDESIEEAPGPATPPPSSVQRRWTSWLPWSNGYFRHDNRFT